MREEAPLAQTPEQRSQKVLYVTIGVLSLVLTLAAVFLVEIGLTRPVVLPILIVLAAVQVLMQAFLFMHLRGSRHVYTYFFLAGLGLAALIGTCLMVLIQSWA
jgi:heme/copper-type cytochrome/quinol oxidase subunit 4